MGTDVNETCVGPESADAGLADSCAGCPNQSICASGAASVPDPAIGVIKERLANVKHKILVLSGKGGVGKSTFTANLAFALSQDESCQVGALDVDICGPSLPKMAGVEGEQIHQSSAGWCPVYVTDNLAVMSIGFLLPNPDDAIIWRGPKKNGMIKQFLKDVDWGDLDYLVIDTPPGTSDEHLSLVQYLSEAGVDGAVVVTTPQDVSCADVRRELGFCRRAGVRVLGVVENMAGFVCPRCGGESVVFPASSGGGRALAAELAVPFLGSIPLDPRIGKSCDYGDSFLDQYKDSPAYTSYMSIVEAIKKSVAP